MQNNRTEPKQALLARDTRSCTKVLRVVAEVSVKSSTKCEDETMKPRMPKLLTKQAPSVGAKLSH